MKLEHTIRKYKPHVQPNPIFVEHLGTRLQQRAQQLAVATPLPTARHKPWYFWSILTAAPILTVLILAIALPNWFKTPSTITGYIQKGPFITGSQITIQELDANLQPNGKNYQVTTASDFGDYVLSQTLSSPYVEVIAQGFYYDEVSGKLSAAPLTLHSIADTSTTTTVNVNVLTTLSAPRIRYLVANKQLPLAVAKQQAEQEVLAVFHITDPTITNFEAMNISKGGVNNAVLLAASVMLQGKQSVAELSELLAKMSLALERDGKIKSDSPLMTTVETNTTALNTSDIHGHLNERFNELGIKVAVPSFEEYLKPFALTAEPFTYRLTLLDNIFGVNQTPGASIKVTIFGDQFEEGQEIVSLKNLYDATSVSYIDDHTLVAEFPIETLSAGSYTVLVRNQSTNRLGLTDGTPLEIESNNVEHTRLILRGYTPTITYVSSTVSYLSGGTVAIHGYHFSYGSFVWINGWQVPNQAIRLVNNNLIYVDLSPALIANNAALPRGEQLTLTVQTPDFQKVDYSGFEIE